MSVRPDTLPTPRPSGVLRVAATAAFAVGCAHTALEPGHATVIPAQNARLVAKQCSRPDPPAFDEAWEPSPAQIEELEKKLPSLGRIPDIASSWRQYVGIVVGGKKLIYVNGFSTQPPLEHWKTEPVIMCDGGQAAWGVLYDPVKRTFSELAFNGMR